MKRDTASDWMFLGVGVAILAIGFWLIIVGDDISKLQQRVQVLEAQAEKANSRSK